MEASPFIERCRDASLSDSLTAHEKYKATGKSLDTPICMTGSVSKRETGVCTYR